MPRRVPMFDQSRLQSMRRDLPEFAPAIMAEIQRNSAGLAKIYLSDLIPRMEGNIKINWQIAENGITPYYETDEELDQAKESLKGYQADLAELEANGHLNDTKKEFDYAKSAYKAGKRI